MSFVDFMIIGAAKCGTTTVSEILSRHPEICFCRQKEPHFFSKFSNWKEQIETYRSLYTPRPNQLCGEASTTYTCFPEFNNNVWHSLYEFNPKLKLIYIMRDPMDRIVSQYMHNYLRGYTSDTFDKSVLNDPMYVNRTRYFVQIKPYLDLFSKEQILLLTLEEFIESKNEFLIKIADFLNISDSELLTSSCLHENRSVGSTKDNISIDNFLKKNQYVQSSKIFFPESIRKKIYVNLQKIVARKITEKPQISIEFKQVIQSLLMLDIIKIEDLLGRKLTEWKSINFNQ
jgi:hypothetical protein